MSLINFAGLATGIDSTAFIQASLNAKRQSQVLPFELRRDVLTDEKTALKDLKNLLNTFRESLSGFRALSGGALTKGITSSNESVVSAQASNSAAQGSYQLEVLSLAKNATLSFGDRFSSPDAVINGAINDLANDEDRVVSLAVGGELVDIEVTSTTTLQGFVNAFNAQSSNGTASVVNTGSSSNPEYAVVINSKATGEAEGSINIVSVGAEIQNAGDGAFVSNTLSQASNLQFSLEGVAGVISRSTNTVNDVIEGVSFSASKLGSATLQVGVDKEASAAAVKKMVEAFNEIVRFVSDNNTVTREENGNQVENIFGPLARTSLDNNALSAIRQAFVSSSLGSGGLVNSLADLGITTERDGTLKFDEEVFGQALDKDSGRASSILEKLSEKLAATGGVIDQFTRFNGLFDQSINSNRDQIQSLSDRISRAEQALGDEEKSLVARFARLEALVSRLQGQQASLTSALAGLGGGS